MDNMNDFNSKGLHFVHMNIRSLYSKNKFEMFKQQISNSKIHLMGLSESWLKKELPSKLLEINNYNVLRLDRKWLENGINKKGGGVCVYVNKNLVYSESKYEALNISSKDIEIQWISINQPNMREIIIANLYRPPQGIIKEFCEKMNICLSSFLDNNKREFIIMGDFNINALNKNSEEMKDLTNLMSSYGLKQFINQITRFGNSDNCLDHIYSNSDYIKSSGTLDWNYSDHQAVFVSRKKSKKITSKIGLQEGLIEIILKKIFRII